MRDAPSERAIAFAQFFDQSPPEWQSWMERTLLALKDGRIFLTDRDTQILPRLPAAGIKAAERWLRRKLIRRVA